MGDRQIYLRTGRQLKVAYVIARSRIKKAYTGKSVNHSPIFNLTRFLSGGDILKHKLQINSFRRLYRK